MIQMSIFNFSKNSQKQNETADSTLNPKDIYTPDNTIVEPVEVEVINLTEKQAVKMGWSYCKKTKNIRITNYHGTEENIIIPSQISDMTVNEIGAKTFFRAQVKSVEIPSSVKKIGEYAFSHSDVERVIFAEGVKNIRDCTFSSCNHLKEIHVPKSLQSIGSYAFAYCPSLEYITLPGGLLFLGHHTFYKSGLKGFAISHPYALKDGSAFADTPLHRNYKVILRSSYGNFYHVLLIGKNANIKFPKGKIFEFMKYSVCDSCTLDFSECGSIRSFHNVYEECINADTGKPYKLFSAKAVVGFNTNNLYFPSYVDVRYPDGTRYNGIVNYIEKEGNYDRVKIKIGGNWIPSYHLRTGAKKIHIHHHLKAFGTCGIMIDKYGINEKNVKSVELCGFYCRDEIFSPFCKNLQEVTWGETHGEPRKYYTVEIKKYIPSAEVLGGYKGEIIHKELLTAFKPLYGEKLNSIYYLNPIKCFFDSTVIDKVFLSDNIHGYDCLNRKQTYSISQRHKILIAIDVLRSTQRKYDSDTQMYKDYLRTHKRYAKIVCEKIAESNPEYLEFLKTIE